MPWDSLGVAFREELNQGWEEESGGLAPGSRSFTQKDWLIADRGLAAPLKAERKQTLRQFREWRFEARFSPSVRRAGTHVMPGGAWACLVTALMLLVRGEDQQGR